MVKKLDIKISESSQFESLKYFQLHETFIMFFSIKRNNLWLLNDNDTKENDENKNEEQ